MTGKEAMGKNLKIGNSQHKKTLGLHGLQRALPTNSFCNSVITIVQKCRAYEELVHQCPFGNWRPHHI